MNFHAEVVKVPRANSVLQVSYSYTREKMASKTFMR